MLNRERCLLAQHALLNGATVQEAATTAGYNDPFYFSRVYKKQFGIRPSAIRTRSRR